MKWLIQLFQPKRSKPDRTFRLNDDESYRQNADIVDGLEFNATLQLRTPLAVLNHHGEIFRGPPSQAPKYGSEAQGIWLPKTKSFRELGIDINEVSESTHASDVGTVKASEYLPFLKSFRAIVESDISVQDQLKMIEKLSEHSTEYGAIYQRLERSYENFPSSYFYLQLTAIGGIGEKTARNLFEMGYLTQAQVLSASPADLQRVQGVGSGLIRRIKGET